MHTYFHNDDKCSHNNNLTKDAREVSLMILHVYDHKEVASDADVNSTLES